MRTYQWMTQLPPLAAEDKNSQLSRRKKLDEGKRGLPRPADRLCKDCRQFLLRQQEYRCAICEAEYEYDREHGYGVRS